MALKKTMWTISPYVTRPTPLSDCMGVLWCLASDLVTQPLLGSFRIQATSSGKPRKGRRRKRSRRKWPASSEARGENLTGPFARIVRRRKCYKRPIYKRKTTRRGFDPFWLGPLGRIGWTASKRRKRVYSKAAKYLRLFPIVRRPTMNN